MSNEGIKVIYNEGRVVGLSAYELYVRKFYEENPGATPPSEKAWLSSMFGAGSAMILKISSGTAAGVQDFALPSNSALCGSNTIVASVFNGDCTWSENAAVSDTGALGYWATSVTSYGGLIENTSESHPNSSNIPYSDSVFNTQSTRNNVINYCKIAEGIVIQQGDWVETTSGTPFEDLTNPQLTASSAVIRLYLAKPLTSDVKIILTGFMDAEFVSSLAGLTGSTDPENNGAPNGEFLGPAIFPWACKILFMYPAIANIYVDDYDRVAPSDETVTGKVGDYEFIGQTSNVNVVSIIDLDTVDPTSYYNINSQYQSSTIPVDVTRADTAMDAFNILSVFEPGMTGERANDVQEMQISDAEKDAYFFPPALYALKVNVEGQQYYVPVDTAAPGTIKMFSTALEAYNYAKQVPNAFAFYWDSANRTLQLFDSNTVSQSSNTDILTKLYAGGGRAIIASDGKVIQTVGISDEHGVPVPMDGANGAIYIGTANGGFCWNDLLNALAANRKIDVLGAALMEFRDNLPNITITGDITCNDIFVRVGKFTQMVQSPLVRVGTDNKHIDITYDTVNSRINVDGDMYVNGDVITPNGRLTDYISRRWVVTTLPAGQTTVTLTDSMFTNTDDSCYRCCASKWGVNPTNVVPGNGTVTLTFRPQSENIRVGASCYIRLP